MTQRSRWAFSRLAKVASAVGAVVLFGASSLLAQGTAGKIEGTVKDQAGAPVGGAQVLIVGSAYQATTDERGYFFMNSVPAGMVTLRAQYIGYAPAEVRNIRVLAGQTMTVNPVLEQRAIEVTGITVTVEQNPIVPRDQVTSKPTVQGETIQELPVDAVSQVLRLQPGVVEGSRGLSIRGSRPGSQATYIDGVLVRNYNSGFGNGGLEGGSAAASASTVGVNSLEEASVTTGAVGAAYGEAEGGVIALVTRSGGSQFHGSVSYGTDNVSGQVYGTGLNRVEASFGGPLLAKNLTFYVSTALQGQQNGLRPLGAQHIPQFVLGGVSDSVMVPLQPYLADGHTPNPTSDSQLVRVPHFTQYASSGGCGYSAPSQAYTVGGDLSANPRTLSAAERGGCTSGRLLNANSDNVGVDGKLQYSFGSGSRVSMSYHVDRNQSLNGYPLYDPLQQTGQRNVGQVLTGNWTQVLSSSSEHSLSLEAALSWQKDQYQSGQVLPSWMEDHQNPFAFFNASSIQFTTDLSNFPITDQLIQNLRLGNCQSPVRCIPYLNRNDLNAASAYRINPYGVASSAFNSEGVGAGGPRLQQETRLTGRAMVDWQANRYNRVQAGFDFTNFTDLAFTSNLITQIFMNAYKDSPKTFGVYGQDRIDLGDLVIELGLRYDHLNTGILYPRAPGRSFSDPIKSANITDAVKYSTYAFNAQDSAMVGACSSALAAHDSTALATCNYFTASQQNVLSPTLRVSFPVTDRTGFRLSYSHQIQTPDMSVLASGTNSDLSNTNTNDIFARPVGFGKTIMFEFGVRHAFSDDMVLDVSAYNKDLVSEGAGRTLNIYDPFVGGDPSLTNEAVNLYTSADFGNVRGIDVRLDRRFGSIFQGTLSYTYQTAKNTGSDPNQYLNTLARTNSAVTGARIPPPQAILTSSDNRSHTIAGNLAATFPAGWHSGTLIGTLLENSGIYATFRAASGLGYTLMENGGLGARGPGNGFGLSATPLEPINSSTMPWIKNVDLRVTRGFRLAGRDLSVFAQFTNLFNFKNLTAIFAETGDVVNQLYQDNAILPQKSLLTSDAGTLWQNRTVTVNGVSQSQTGVNLQDCSAYKYANDGSRGAPDCLLLRQAEARFGNGDNFFDSNEISTAYNAWFNRAQGPYTFYGNGFNMRLGFEFNF
jgi:hypothetical protein